MGIQDEIRKLVNTESAKHKRLIQYTERQLRTGRDLDDVLQDPYIINRLTPVERLALLDEPEVIEAASDELLMRMRADLQTMAGA
jgi:hypothetical protein